MEYSSNQIRLMQIASVVLVLVFVLNLVHIVYNIYKYVYGLKMNKTLIIVFYTLISVATLTKITEFSTRAFDPEHGFFPNDNHPIIFYTNRLGLTFTICIELTLILTIHKLLLGLKLMTGKLNRLEVKKQDVQAQIITAIFFVISLVSGILVYLILQKETFV